MSRLARAVKPGPSASLTGFTTLHDLEGEKVRPQNRGPGALGVTIGAVPAGGDPVAPVPHRVLRGAMEKRYGPEHQVLKPGGERVL